jgi:hypothetical protein
MPTVNIKAGNRNVLVETDEPVGQAQAGLLDLEASLTEAKEITLRLASGFGDMLQAIADQARPDELEITFGLKVSGEAGWIVAKAGTEANFEIKLKWGG